MDYRWIDLLCMVNRISVSGYPDCYDVCWASLVEFRNTDSIFMRRDLKICSHMLVKLYENFVNFAYNFLSRALYAAVK